MKLPNTPFPSYVNNQLYIDAAWSLCEDRWSRLRQPISQLAQRFLSRVAEGGSSHRAYFSNPLAPPLLYMPQWLFESLYPDKQAQIQLAPRLVDILAGTLLGYIGIRIQDDILDERGGADPQMLLFGNTCFSGMVAFYSQALEKPGSSFWSIFDRDFVDFSCFTLAERETILQGETYLQETFDQHAEKVAFARTPLLAVASLAERLDLDPLIRTLIHQLGIAYGLVNDVVGWPRDLRAGQRTWLLASAGLSQHALDHAMEIPEALAQGNAFMVLEEQLRPVLYEKQILRRAVDRSIEVQQQAADTAQALGLAGFSGYTQDRIAWLKMLQHQISLVTLSRVLRGETSSRG